MNGVYCQVRVNTMVSPGWSVVQATPGRPIQDSTSVTMPLSASRIEYFQISAAAAGMIRNGVISKVRARAWPRNLRSSRIANNNPSSSDRIIDSPTIQIVAHSDGRNAPLVTTAM